MLDEVGVDKLGRKAQVRLYVSAPLAHAVYLGLFQIEACSCGCIAYDGGYGEDALSSHAG